MRPARALLPLAGAGVLAAVAAAAWPFTVDDAFILGRYARRIATGAGYTMTAGPPTDGVTGPLALAPGLIGQLGWGDPVAASKLVGAIASALAVALVIGRASRESVARGWVALIVASAGATLGIWSVAGLETGLATLALTVAALAVTARQEGSILAPGIAAGIAVAALAWLRPETALACGVLLVALARRDGRGGAIAWALAAAGAIGIVAFRLALFGSPLPLSAQAKPPDLVNGAAYVARGLVVALGGGGVLVGALAAREGRGEERILFAALIAHLVALVLAGGDWMPGFRLFAPLIPIYALVVSRPIAARLRGKAGRAIALLALAGLLPLVDLALELPRAREAGEARESRGAALADWLGSRARRVAMVDVGYLAYRSGVEVIDLGGVTDPSIGRGAGGHLDKRIDPGLLRERAPDAIVLHSSVEPRVDAQGRLRWLAGYPVEQRVARMPWVIAEMRVARVVEYEPAYFYVVLTPR